MEPDLELSSVSGISQEDLDAELVNRYAERLLCVARSRLGDHLRAKVSPEDVVQSAFKSFFRRRSEFHFREDGADGLWALLVMITIRKCCKWADLFGRQKRAANREVSASPTADHPAAIEGVSAEPTPEEAVQCAELVERLLSRFEPRKQKIVSLRMQGWELEEIAAEVLSSRRTVARVIAEAKVWLTELLREAE